MGRFEIPVTIKQSMSRVGDVTAFDILSCSGFFFLFTTVWKQNENRLAQTFKTLFLLLFPLLLDLGIRREWVKAPWSHSVNPQKLTGAMRVAHPPSMEEYSRVYWVRNSDNHHIAAFHSHPPHAVMITSGVEVPNSKTLRNLQPRRKVLWILHFYV